MKIAEKRKKSLETALAIRGYDLSDFDLFKRDGRVLYSSVYLSKKKPLSNVEMCKISRDIGKKGFIDKETIFLVEDGEDRMLFSFNGDFGCSDILWESSSQVKTIKGEVHEYELVYFLFFEIDNNLVKFESLTREIPSLQGSMSYINKHATVREGSLSYVKKISHGDVFNEDNFMVFAGCPNYINTDRFMLSEKLYYINDSLRKYFSNKDFFDYIFSEKINKKIYDDLSDYYLKKIRKIRPLGSKQILHISQDFNLNYNIVTESILSFFSNAAYNIVLSNTKEAVLFKNDLYKTRCLRKRSFTTDDVSGHRYSGVEEAVSRLQSNKEKIDLYYKLCETILLNRFESLMSEAESVSKIIEKNILKK